MSEKSPEDPVMLCMVGTEVEATMIADALSDRGIEAMPSGVITGGFRAEAPGRVQVLVHRHELAKARAALEEYRNETQNIDWSQVDLGSPE